ncbi:hypothetical protein GDO81_018932 [Engystomops pustulosus]|uniref:Thyroxine-binding globulin n=1 Tax=Engystomops pustulosus TaxID=76066 RepID=A0AAV6ZGF4_ENGPU|nr:hypothetical protein GDO81_018932 [Engystomops pustulosus]
MQLPLLLLFFISLTIGLKDDKLKKDDCGCQWEGAHLSKANMNFAVSLFKFLFSKTTQSPPNLFLSPLSIYTSLAMLGLGARSLTRQQILSAMCINTAQGDKTLKDDFKNFLKKLRTKEGNVELKFSNWLFLEESNQPETQYQQDVASYYNASVQSVSFAEPQKAGRKINEQVSGRTDGKIEDLVDNLDDQTVMVMLDYVTFNANWESPFVLQENEHGHFKVNQTKMVQVQMMHRVGQYKTYKDHLRHCIIIEVPYTDQLALLLIVPKYGHIDEVQHGISVQLIHWYLIKMRTSLLDLYIPKISLEQQVNMQDALLKMGIQEAFSDTAELYGISKQLGLKVSSIYQKNLIRIAENGTESSGAEVIQGITHPLALELKVDRPFFAFVYSKRMKTILLMGRVMDPSQD